MSHLENTISSPLSTDNSLLPNGTVCSPSDDKGVVHCHTVDIRAVAPEKKVAILQKGAVIDHLGARDDQTIMMRRFFVEISLSRSLRPSRLWRSLRSLRLQRFCCLGNHY